MGILDFLKNGRRCSVCGNKNQLHRKEPPVCDKCYWHWYIDQIQKNTGLVRERNKLEKKHR
jgi:hypothetical protein